jgi:hypothetical protein
LIETFRHRGLKRMYNGSPLYIDANLRARVADILTTLKTGLSPEMAVRPSKAFGSSPKMWMRLKVNDKLAKIRRPKIAVKRYPLHQFQDQRAIFYAVDRGDVGVVERGQHLRLAEEARHPAGVGGESPGEDLDGYVAVEFGIGRAPHFAHTALAELRRDAVVRDG